MTDEDILTALRMRVRELKFMRYLGGAVDSVSQEKQQAILRFYPGDDLCQTAGSIQGGFIAAMLDAAMAHSVLVASAMKLGPPTLEMKVSFFRPGIPGPHKAIGRTVRLGKSVGFLEAELFNSKDELIAKSSATARLVQRDLI